LWDVTLIDHSDLQGEEILGTKVTLQTSNSSSYNFIKNKRKSNLIKGF